MDIVSSFKARIIGMNHIARDTLRIYRKAVAFLIDVVNAEWEDISVITEAKERQAAVERLVHGTKLNAPKYPGFDASFHKFPSYLRRAAIQEAIGHVSSYRTNMANWQKDKVGRPPSLSRNTKAVPVFYRGNMYRVDPEDPNAAYIKLYIDRDWRWVKIRLRRQDMRYIERHWDRPGVKKNAPSLFLKRDKLYLVFSFTENVELSDKDIFDRRIVGVDLGINSDAVMSLMDAEGTVLARKFLDFASEKDHLYHMLDIIRKIQRRSGSRYTHCLWEYASHLNRLLAEKIAAGITEFAENCGADVIVFEHLDIKKRPSRAWRQKLAMWRKNDIQRRVEHKAHRLGIRISRVNAWGTSSLAFDGSGEVTRDNENRALCTFSTGKRYNCDLSASYNIGARYFVREIDKTLAEKTRSRIAAKVPGFAARTKCTLSTLISLRAELLQHAA